MNVNLRELFSEATERLAMEVAEEVVAEIRVRAPAGKTGALRDGYRAEPANGGANISNPLAPYWVHVEYGHNIVDQRTGEVVGHAGQRAHVRPAIEAIRRLRMGGGDDE